MADSAAFDFVCGELESRSSLNRLEARGTVRLALKEAGFAAASVTPVQIRAVVERVLPRQLASRGIADGDALCTHIAAGLSGVADAGGAESPEAIFARLGGGA